MKLIAKKPCSFGGEKFYIGDEIPAEYVLDPKAQERLGVLTIVNVAEEDGDGHDCDQAIVIPDVTRSILVHTDNGDLELEPTDEGIQDIFTILTGKAENANAIINEMNDEDALILLHLADGRKSVKNAAEARAKALSSAQESEGEQ